MINNINKHLGLIEKFLKWVNETETLKGAKGEQVHNEAVAIRRILKKKKFALEGNPCVAVFGQSQVGKSYLIDALLSDTDNGKVFCITDPRDGRQYKFKDEMNPSGGGSESTAVVSRFASDYEPFNPEYPIKALLLSPADIVLVLCDSYYKDVKRDEVIGVEEIEAKMNSLKSRYSGSGYCQSCFTEDEVWDIIDYIQIEFSAEIFDKYRAFLTAVSTFVEKVPSNEWKEVFSVLWNNDAKYTALFDKIITAYGSLGFTKELYLPIEAVLRENGTLLDVEILKGISQQVSNTKIKHTTTVLVKDKQVERIVADYPKAALSALIAELVFSLPEETRKIKDFLVKNKTDLLDFPGARARKTTPAKNISDSGMWEFFLRGKVSYLFNKYSLFEKISMLFFCAKHEQPTERAMPEILAPLVKRVVGETPESREEYIRRIGNIPPLFIIGTFFNVNLAYDSNKDIASKVNTADDPLAERWKQRFDKSLTQLVDPNAYDWFNNWTKSNPYFNNIFFLRDFGYSTDTFTGYCKDPFQKENGERENPAAFPDFREKLRQSFLDYEFVKQHFENPAEAWDEAASVNKDGTGLIINKLTVASEHINPARMAKIRKEVALVLERTLALFNEQYNSPEKAEQIKQAISKAGDIRLNLAVAFGRNPYFFGRMMREMMLTNSDVYEFYGKALRNIENHDVKNLDKYEAIRLLVPELDSEKDFMFKLEALLTHLKKSMEDRTPEEWTTYFKEEYGWILDDLFESKRDRVKSRSRLLVEALEQFWFKEFLPSKQAKLAEVLPQPHFENLLVMFERLYAKLQISTIISDRIRRYVDGYRDQEEVFEMISDISTEMINRFVATVGTDYYQDFNYKDLEEASKNIKGLSWERPELQYEGNDREEVAQLIGQMGNLSELLSRRPIPNEVMRLPIYRNYIEWYNRIDAGFVTASGVPDYDPVANEKLGKIIAECETIKL